MFLELEWLTSTGRLCKISMLAGMFWLRKLSPVDSCFGTTFNCKDARNYVNRLHLHNSSNILLHSHGISWSSPSAQNLKSHNSFLSVFFLSFFFESRSYPHFKSRKHKARSTHEWIYAFPLFEPVDEEKLRFEGKADIVYSSKEVERNGK